MHLIVNLLKIIWIKTFNRKKYDTTINNFKDTELSMLYKIDCSKVKCSKIEAEKITVASKEEYLNQFNNLNKTINCGTCYK